VIKAFYIDYPQESPVNAVAAGNELRPLFGDGIDAVIEQNE
jgi:hypothetical protein